MTNVAAAVTVLLTHCTNAGAGLTPPITDVARADPVPRGRCIRVWYGGETDPPAMYANRSGNSEMVGEIVHLTTFWPVGSSAEVLASARDAEVYSLKHDLRTRILADSNLGGNVVDLTLAHFTSDFIEDGGGLWRVLDTEVHLSYVEYPIAP